MAGLLGDGWSDPRSAAIMGLAQGLLQGNFGAGIGQAQQNYGASQDSLLKRQMMTEDLSLKRLAEQRAQMLFQAQMQEYAGGAPGASAPSGTPAIPATPGMAGGVLGSGTAGIDIPPTAGSPASSPAPQNDLGAQLAALKRQTLIGMPGVKERLDILKYANDPQKVDPGSYSRNSITGALTFNADPKVGLTLGPNGDIQRMPGSQNIAGMAGDATAAQEAAKDQFAAPTMVNTPQGPRLMTPAQARQYANGGAQPAPRPVLGGQPTAANFGGDPPAGSGIPNNDPNAAAREIAATQASMKFAKDPQTRALLQAHIDELQGQQQKYGLPTQPLPGGELKTSGQDATDAANKAFLEGRAKNMNAYEESLNGKVTQGGEMNMRLQEQLKALDQFRAGGGGETRAQLASIAQAMPGVPPSVVNGIAGGDLSAMQEFNKLAAQTAMEQLKSSMGGAGRISQYEFKVFQHNNPNLSTDPDAIRKIFDFNTKLYNRDLQEQQAFGQHVASGADPAAFPAKWAQQLSAQGYTDPTMKAQNAAPASVVDELPKNAPVGSRARDTVTGKIMKFNGLSWTPEK